MPVILPTPWNDLVNEMQTGDLILFSGTSSESEWIKLFTLGHFSHSAMIFSEFSRMKGANRILFVLAVSESMRCDANTKFGRRFVFLGLFHGSGCLVSRRATDRPSDHT